MKSKGGGKKNPVIEFIIVLVCGVFCLSVSLGLIFGVYRPFVPWQKITCRWAYDGEIGGNTVERKDGNGMTYIYRFTLDDEYYEVPLKVYNHAHGNMNTRHIVFVNRNNPYDAKAGHYGTLFLVTLLIFGACGAGTVAFACINYMAKTGGKSKNKREKAKEKL